MKLSRLKQIITEEVNNHRLDLIEESINKLQNSIANKVNLHEGILSSILGIFLEPKYKKKAEEFKTSPEYKELIHQMELSTKSLSYLTDKLKDKIDEYEKGIDSMQKAGIKVKAGMSPKAMWKEYEKWASKINKSSKKEQLVKINPDWEKFLK